MNKTFVTCVVVLLSMVAGMVAASETCDLRCWVKKMVININEDINFSSVITGGIRNLKIHSIELGDIISQSPAPSTPDKVSFYAKVNINHAQASGDWWGKKFLSSGIYEGSAEI